MKIIFVLNGLFNHPVRTAASGIFLSFYAYNATQNEKQNVSIMTQ